MRIFMVSIVAQAQGFFAVLRMTYRSNLHKNKNITTSNTITLKHTSALTKNTINNTSSNSGGGAKQAEAALGKISDG